MLYYCYLYFIKSQSNSMSEYIHVSQLYETVITTAVLILLITQSLAGYNKLWGFITQIRSKQRDNELQWIKSAQGGKNQEKDEAQKSAIQSLRKQMSQYQNKQGQSQSQKKPPREEETEKKDSINDLLGELDPALKPILLFYIQFNNFMSQYVSIIMSMLVIGIITSSTMVFSLACFFCYLFCSILFDFLHLQQRLKQEHKKGVVLRRIVKILSGCIILAMFIDYWASQEFEV